jgi:hypothetical protein
LFPGSYIPVTVRAGSSPDYNLSELVRAMNIKHRVGGSDAMNTVRQDQPPLTPSPTGKEQKEIILSNLFHPFKLS